MISKQKLATLEDVLWWLPAPTKLNSLVCTSDKLPGPLSPSVAGTMGLWTLLDPQEVSTVAARHGGGLGKAYRESLVLVSKM